MIVADASAVLDLLLRTPRSEALERELLGAGDELHAPELLDVEIAQGLRRLCLAGQLPERRAAAVLEDLAQLFIVRHGHQELVRRAWQLRDVMTVYDGVYVALAEGLSAPLLTCDARLARSHGHRAAIRLP